ncbi:MAG: hypothetical protein HZA83_02635 [Thaumarchaeota archaeon]|nr:hypothetical protein [Nitrososphaerota archaeon]
MRILALFVLLLTFLHAATVYGEIIDPEDFEALNNTIIKISGPTTMQIIASENYSVDLAPGAYNMTAQYIENGKLKYYAKETITVGNEIVHFDIIPLPLDFQQVYDVDFEELPDVPEKQEPGGDALIVVAVFAIAIIVIMFFVYRGKNKKQDGAGYATPDTKLETKRYVPDSDGKTVLKILEENEGRLTQKELRQILKWSEAKMSLVVAELEATGKIIRIKKGRENILKIKERVE